MNKPKVLIAEDEPLLTDMLCTVFEEQGFETVTFGTADEAVSFLKLTRTHLDLLFTDVRMPGALSGLDLAAVAQALQPGLPVVVSSGYYEPMTSKLDQTTLLPKPWKLEALESVCRKACRKVS
ncbi:response regulator [Pseudomonas sp. Marseille-Q7302]